MRALITRSICFAVWLLLSVCQCPLASDQAFSGDPFPQSSRDDCPFLSQTFMNLSLTSDNYLHTGVDVAGAAGDYILVPMSIEDTVAVFDYTESSVALHAFSERNYRDGMQSLCLFLHINPADQYELGEKLLGGMIVGWLEDFGDGSHLHQSIYLRDPYLSGPWDDEHLVNPLLYANEDAAWAGDNEPPVIDDVWPIEQEHTWWVFAHDSHGSSSDIDDYDGIFSAALFVNNYQADAFAFEKYVARGESGPLSWDQFYCGETPHPEGLCYELFWQPAPWETLESWYVVVSDHRGGHDVWRDDELNSGCFYECGETWACMKYCLGGGATASAFSSWPTPKTCTETASGTICHPQGVFGRMGGFDIHWGNEDPEAWEYVAGESEGDEESYEQISDVSPGPPYYTVSRLGLNDSVPYFYRVASLDSVVRKETTSPGAGSIVGVGQCNLASEPICTALDTTNSVLFIGEKGGILEVVDVYDPNDPEVIATHDLGDYDLWYNAFDDPCVLEFDGHLWVICGNNGLAVLQLHHGYTMMDVLTEWGTPGRDVALSGDYAYYTTNGLELEVLELTYDSGQHEYDLVKCGEYQYSCPNGFEIQDSYVFRSGGAAYLYVLGDSLSHCDGHPCLCNRRLQVVDITSPCNPYFVKTGIAGFSSEIRSRAGDLLFGSAYAVDGGNGYNSAIDVSDPTDPERITSWKNGLFNDRGKWSRQQVAADEDRLYAIGYANVHYPSPSRYGEYAKWGGLECYTMCNGNIQMFSAAATDTGFDAAGDTSLVATTIIATDKTIYMTYKCAPDTDTVQDPPFNRLKVYIDHYEYGDFASVWERETDESSGLSFSVAGPNPFTRNCSVRMTIPHKGRVELAVWDVRGRHVRTLAEGYWEPGAYEIAWDGRDSNGLRVASGMYFIRLESGSLASTRKIVLLR